MNYQNQICDGCKRPLLDGEDVVVCPVCGTPQHRACYEKENACVNADRHADHYVWTAEALPDAPAAGSFACPVCGTNNPQGSEECPRCGQRFSRADAPTPQPAAAHRDIRTLFPELPQESGELRLDDASYEMLCDNILQRADAVAPGMTAEQAQEVVAGHPIRQVLTFIASKPLVYINKFRKVEAHRLSWNWAAFFFTPYWYFYRKLYKPGIIFLTLRLCLTLLVYPASNTVTEIWAQMSEAAANNTLTEELMRSLTATMLQNAWPVYAAGGALLLMAIVSALLADRLYLRHVGNSLRAIKNEETCDGFLVSFVRRSSVSFLALAVSYAALSFIPSLLISIFTNFAP